jgi:RND family efflux transporter MFP subunit
VDGSAAAYYSGTIEAQRSIPLSFLTLGKVLEVNVREGQQVQKGELLARLDCQSNETALSMAEAKSRQADDAFRRFEPMYKNGNLPEIKMVEIETGRTEATLALKMAAKNATDCSITAPESGIISDRSVEPGSSAIPGKAALRLVTVDRVYASISVPEGEISRIKPGMRAKVEVSALQEDNRTDPGDSRTITLPLSQPTPSRGGKFIGVVTDSGVSPNPLARTYNVRVLVNNPGRRILPGMICNVYISNPGLSKLTLVPSTAVSMDEAGQHYVYVVVPGTKTVRRRPLQAVGFARGGILVSRGLAEGETVVSVGVQKLTDGALVTAE